ncbi:RNA polymerase sigma-70 factor (ECF subfamily) [Gillisia sp. Hel_I_86]|uniref:RNA polymerase sigma factor n=1 Tax=Gillisia sp. Hel_I_86 TaxID=1249981 RepID=UPI00119BA0A9|nr:RNA polymerase sigma-70 factor [Gillisia sp. Hel_I_86]TVZ25216.1 RNA polymerase sigma-70 factor (ECF subfamily) [Gillisia sp. Hel_I_86]
MRRRFKENANLIGHLKKGDGDAFSFLVNSYNHQLCVYANSLVNDKALAEDIVQNVYIKTWEKRKYLNECFSIKSFLYKSVHNEFIDQYRKNRSVTILEKKYIETLDAIVEEDYNVLEKLYLLVQNEIQNLPPKCKNIFLLSKKEGLSNVEISEHLNISTKTVEAHITKAFCLIRERVSLPTNMGAFLFLLFV